MHERFRTISGFIVKNLPFGENDAYVTMFTAEHGTMRLIARGALCIASRRRTALQPLTKSRLLIERHHEQWYVREATAEQTFCITEKTHKKICFLGQIMKIIDHLAHDASTTIFTTLEEAYTLAERANPYLLHLICAKILTLLGLFPAFGEDMTIALKISPSVRRLLHNIPHYSCTELSSFHARPEEQKEAARIIQKIYRKVVTENTSGTAPIRSMTIAISS